MKRVNPIGFLNECMDTDADEDDPKKLNDFFFSNLRVLAKKSEILLSYVKNEIG